MKLRARLALVVLVTALPVIGGIVFLQQRMQWSAAEQSLADYALDRMQGGGREACEIAPEAFPLWQGGRQPERGPERLPGPRGAPPRPRLGGPPDPLQRGPEVPPRGPAEPINPDVRTELWAYAPDFTSRNREAPTFPGEVREALLAGESHASVEWFVPERNGIAVGVRMPWDSGPCAFILVRRSRVSPPGAQRDLLIGTATLLAVLLGAVMVGAGPVVARVRRLTAQVRASAAARYATPAEVSGSDEITDLARAFNSAADEVRGSIETIENRERTLRQFLENTTHDVMVPLTVLQGHLTALRRRFENAQGEERGVVLEALQEAHYMASLIHNLSAAARLESGKVELERHRVDLAALVERAVARHAPIARARGLALEHAVPPEPVATSGDVTLLEQAVSNLIHNAVRYVEPGGHVAVVLEAREGRFALRVLDDGPGIPAELRSRVFERAFRADGARSRHPDGLGLGLSIARDVLERHGFELELRQPSERGTEFEIRGPLAS
ncbi:MAG: HAMP domain-containing sensor histidine kinase [Planctomycetota bacterium]|nr:HAMP domain-containing sensor histidine kinase [Planctomycetota bacterium]